MMTKEKLGQLFKWIDKDGSKSISLDELRTILSIGKDDSVTEGVWKEMIGQIDLNGDGEVTSNKLRLKGADFVRRV